MSEFQIVTGDAVDTAVAANFLRRMFSLAKSKFVIQYGQWLYRDLRNQWFVLFGDQIIGYCAVIPINCAVAGNHVPALWWVDLIVDPAFRGRGIQTLIDEQIRTVADLKLGFPNKLAAAIHRKHGWGVREDGEVLLLPLRPLAMPNICQATGLRGIALRLAAAALTPWLKGWQWHLHRYQPITARRLPMVDPDLLAGVFQRYYDPQTITTYRDADYFRWRFGEAPYREALGMYVTGPTAAPSHYLVTHLLQQSPASVMRVLDFYGDFTDLAGMHDILRLAVSEAIAKDAAQVTIMSFAPVFSRWLRQFGFVLRAAGRFCWYSTSDETVQAFAAQQYWTLADSDNDAPL